MDNEKNLERFKSYVRIETTSDENSKTFPSTSGQEILAKFLENELKKIGMSGVSVDENYYVLAHIPSNLAKEVKANRIGLIAHMDTSSEASGENVQVAVHEKYNGADLLLNKDKNIELKVNEFPNLKKYVGQDIITTDGTTLLGADDKAGICEIVSACEHVLNNKELKHGYIGICFTPDEEIGRGTEYFPFERFKVDYAYTVDGGAIGELNYETFNAINGKIKFKGRAVHPGYAKNIMVNAITLAAEFQSNLPKIESPEHTSGYEGFYYVNQIHGNTEVTELEIIIRDHNYSKLQARKQRIFDIVEKMKAIYGEDSVEVDLKEAYRNMKDYIKKDMTIVDNVVQAMKMANVNADIKPIRGGTDGARLSEEGLLCPNIFTGGENFHSRFEFLPIQSMQKAIEVLINLIEVK